MVGVDLGELRRGDRTQERVAQARADPNPNGGELPGRAHEERRLREGFDVAQSPDRDAGARFVS